jgi:sodium transport system ATP-binding protein
MIDVRDVHKRFGTVQALEGVSFTARNGSITGLLGENGAGKTTMLSLVCGLLHADQGSIRVGCEEHGSIGRRRRIGALLDHKGLYDRLTARENIAYFGHLHGMSGNMLAQRVDTLISDLGLRSVANRRVAGFSQGERMKVALARAIVHAPQHVLLDEPTNGLDIPSVHGLRHTLRQMRDNGMCVILSSHVLDEVRALCDTIVVISRGRVVASGEPARICRKAGRATLEEAFLSLTGREEMVS